MKVNYDKEIDALVFTMSKNQIHESDEIKPGVILDFDKDGNLVRIEILDASKKKLSPNQMQYEVN